MQAEERPANGAGSLGAMARLRVAACQINTVVGDLAGNADRILAALAAAEERGADLAVFPELTVTGYPPEDLLGRPAFIADNLAAFERVAAATRACAAVVGFVDADAEGRLVNAAAICADGRVLGVYHKHFLPNYGVFDEQRWFTPGGGPPTLYVVAGVPVGMTICEDMWFGGGPMADQAAAGARVLVNLNASPYSRGRRGERLAVLTDRVAETGCAIVYVNQVGGQDELVFDGASLVMDADGRVVGGRPPVRRGGAAGRPGRRRRRRSRWRRGGWRRAAGSAVRGPTVAVGAGPGRSAAGPARHPVAPVLDPEAEVYEALVLGTRDYVGKNGFADAVIGLSGGIDSSLVAAVAVDALGAEHVHGVAMPSRYSSEGSVDRCRGPGRQPGDRHRQPAPIEAAHHALAATLAPLHRRRAQRSDRREPAVEDPGRAAHGPVQRQRVDRAHHRQQERDGHRLLDPLRRLGRRVRRHQGRGQDAGLRAVPLPEPAGGLRAHPRGRC